MSRTEGIEEVGSICTVYGAERHSEELAEFGEDRVCGNCKDTYRQCLREGVNPSSLNTQCYRDGDLLIMDREAKLPLDVCCYCGRPSKAKLSFRIPSARNGMPRGYPQQQVGICRRHRWFQIIRVLAFGFNIAGFLVLLSWGKRTLPKNIAEGLPWPIAVYLAPIALYFLFFILGHLIISKLGMSNLKAKKLADGKISVSGLGEEYFKQFPGK